MAAQAGNGWVVGVDIGGTFTDLIAFDESTRTVHAHKELTTPSDPNAAVSHGLARLFQHNGLHPGAVSRVVHATTLFTNTLIERKGASVGLITTEGFRDTVEIARERKYELYDLQIQMAQPLCPRERRFEVTERVEASGRIVATVSEEQLLRVAARAIETGCDSLAVCFINSFVNPANELAAKAMLSRAYPRVAVSASSEVANEIREYDRFSTALANAYIQPLAERYLRDFRASLQANGIHSPVYVMLSNGGFATVERAVAAPIQLLESGPAAGALAAAYFARMAGVGDVMALDIGGTTAKLCTIEDGVPLITHSYEAARERRFVADSGLPIRIPTIDLIEIGAGGGSVARKDQLGLLKVGPQSAGSDPGPVSYGRGGTEPTVTDSNLVLGLLNPGYFAGGEIRLDAVAGAGVLAKLGEELAIGPTAAAAGVHDLANENMAAAARVHAAQRGRDPASLTLVVTGGGGPIHGAGVARKLGIRTMVCPPAAGVASAIGLVLAPARVDKVGFVAKPLAREGMHDLEERFGDLEARARDDLRQMALDGESAALRRFADMRYRGQGFELFVSLPQGPYDEVALDMLQAAFDAEYRRVFGHTIDKGVTEIVNARVTAVLELTDRERPIRLPAETQDTSRASTSREVHFPGQAGEDGPGAQHLTQVRRWENLWRGVEVDGPCLIEQEGTTLVVALGDRLKVSASGSAVLNMGQTQAVSYGGDLLNNVTLEVLWRRLIGIVDEASAALVRASFSTVVRESDDYSIVITDQRGRLMAQGTKSIPVFISSLPRTVKHFLGEFGVSGLEEGDVLITNDPWLGTGHLADINLALPIFHEGCLVAFAASTAHAADIGGRSGAQKIPDVFEEGFQIPMMKLARRGDLDGAVLALLRRNVRAPDQVLGDLFGQMAALKLVRKRLLSVLGEWRLPDFAAFANEAFRRTEQAMRQAIRTIPAGVYRAEQATDGMDEPIMLRAAVTVAQDRIVVDYEGTSGQIPAALNVAYCYTHAFTVYALKCLLDRESPNNEGSFAALDVVAPEGSILNHQFPFSGANRALVGHFLPSLVLHALSVAMPDRVIAGVGSPIWSFLLRGCDSQGQNVVLKCFFNGGMGASTCRDGLNATSWPSNISSAPVEVIEQLAPVRVNFKQLCSGSGGAGCYRGGLGLEAEFEVLDEGPFRVGFNAERTRSPANGLFGGDPGAVGELRINGDTIDIREQHQVTRGDRILVRTPGGGGVGDRASRSPDLAARDVARQYT